VETCERADSDRQRLRPIPARGTIQDDINGGPHGFTSGSEGGALMFYYKRDRLPFLAFLCCSLETVPEG
jgi:hypothetical protein